MPARIPRRVERRHITAERIVQVILARALASSRRQVECMRVHYAGFTPNLVASMGGAENPGMKSNLTACSLTQLVAVALLGLIGSSIARSAPQACIPNRTGETVPDVDDGLPWPGNTEAN